MKLLVASKRSTFEIPTHHFSNLTSPIWAIILYDDNVIILQIQIFTKQINHDGKVLAFVVDGEDYGIFRGSGTWEGVLEGEGGEGGKEGGRRTYRAPLFWF